MARTKVRKPHMQTPCVAIEVLQAVYKCMKHVEHTLVCVEILRVHAIVTSLHKQQRNRRTNYLVSLKQFLYSLISMYSPLLFIFLVRTCNSKLPVNPLEEKPLANSLLQKLRASLPRPLEVSRSPTATVREPLLFVRSEST